MQKKQRKVYVNARQTEQENVRKRKRDDERKEIFKAATREVAAAKVADALGKSSGSTYEAIAARHQSKLPEGARPITAASLKKAGYRHAPGASPKKTGPKPKLPPGLYTAAASFAQLKQVAGQDCRTDGALGRSHERRFFVLYAGPKPAL